MATHEERKPAPVLRCAVVLTVRPELDRKRCPQPSPHISVGRIRGFVSGTQTQGTDRQILSPCIELCLQIEEKLISFSNSLSHYLNYSLSFATICSFIGIIRYLSPKLFETFSLL